MMRTASTVCLSAWCAFLGIGAVRLLGEAGAFPAGLQVHADNLLLQMRQGETLGLDSASAVPFSALLLGIGAVFALSIVRLNSHRRSVASTGEQAAAAGLAAIFAFWLSAVVAGSPIALLFSSGTGFCFALAFTLGALLFDHMMQADESESDEAFETLMRRLEGRSNTDNNREDF